MLDIKATTIKHNKTLKPTFCVKHQELGDKISTFNFRTLSAFTVDQQESVMGKDVVITHLGDTTSWRNAATVDQ